MGNKNIKAYAEKEKELHCIINNFYKNFTIYGNHNALNDKHGYGIRVDISIIDSNLLERDDNCLTIIQRIKKSVLNLYDVTISFYVRETDQEFKTRILERKDASYPLDRCEWLIFYWNSN